uniref:Uncharacterized protein LOC100176276 n=1 Tax=Phallusia mammillata TaxID=59560 RepID=A0A6F9DHB3_9ASCI|nr:uncharacterized protein LOC100176276 [Phallusia mammillata]
MASSNPSIKECITLMCRLLKYAPNPIHVNPDTFRQAKHNNPAAVDEMLKLVHIMLATDKTKLQGPLDADMKEALIEKLENSGYPRVHMLKTNLTSLELLLCFGWLLHITKILTQIYRASLEPTDIFSILLCEKHKVKIPSPFQSSENLDISGLETMLSGTIGPKLEHDKFDAMSVADQINHVAWMSGKVEMKMSALNSLYLFTAKIDAQIQKQTHSATAKEKTTFDSLTANEALLFKHSKILQLCEKDMERKVQIIQAYNKWKDMEPKFWQWLHGAAYDEIQEEYLPSMNSSDVPIIDALTEGLESTAASIEQVKSMLYDKQREWLELAKTDSGHLAKVRVEQEHEISKEVQALLLYVNSMENSFKLALSSDAKGKGGPAHSPTIPISNEIQRLRTRALQIADQLREMEHLSGEELTIIVNSKLNGNAILVPATAVT